MSLCHICVPKILMVWSTVPKIWSMMACNWQFWVIFCPFTSLKPRKNQKFEKMKKITWDIIILQMCTINDDHMIYSPWDTEWDGHNFFFLVILGHFLHFNPPKNPKNQNFEKMKTTPGGIIILHMCTINDHHMMYASWDMECDRQNFFVIPGQFLPFYLTHDWKNQNFEKKKKTLEISSFCTSVTKIMIICYTVPETWQVTAVIFIFHFGLFFAPLYP